MKGQSQACTLNQQAEGAVDVFGQSGDRAELCSK